jgi:hypothetical protein
LLKICLSAGYLIYGVYGHFIDTNGLSLPGLKTPSNPNVFWKGENFFILISEKKNRKNLKINKENLFFFLFF